MTTWELVATTITALGTGVLSSLATTIMTRSKIKIEIEKTAAETEKIKSDQRLNEADGLNEKYGKLLAKVEEYNLQLEAQNTRLEAEIERSKKQELVCQGKLQDYEKRLLIQENEIKELKQLVSDLKQK